MKFGFDLFEINYPTPGDLDAVDKEIRNLQNIWGLREEWDRKYQHTVKDIKFKEVNCDSLENEAAHFLFRLQDMTK